MLGHARDQDPAGTHRGKKRPKGQEGCVWDPDARRELGGRGGGRARGPRPCGPGLRARALLSPTPHFPLVRAARDGLEAGRAGPRLGFSISVAAPPATAQALGFGPALGPPPPRTLTPGPPSCFPPATFTCSWRRRRALLSRAQPRATGQPPLPAAPALSQAALQRPRDRGSRATSARRGDTAALRSAVEKQPQPTAARGRVGGRMAGGGGLAEEGMAATSPRWITAPRLPHPGQLPPPRPRPLVRPRDPP